MKVTPLDLRQQTFRTTMRGFDRGEVLSFLKEVADDYEQALKENAKWQQDLSHMQSALNEHREHEKNLRNTLLTAQRLADEIRENAQQESRMIVREAEGRSDLLLQKTQVRVEEIHREIQELRLKRRDVENSLESSIAAVRNTLDFVRQQDARERAETAALTRPRSADAKTVSTPHTIRTAASPGSEDTFVAVRVPENTPPGTKTIDAGIEAVQRFIDESRTPAASQATPEPTGS